jgi:hypothetical protein
MLSETEIISIAKYILKNDHCSVHFKEEIAYDRIDLDIMPNEIKNEKTLTEYVISGAYNDYDKKSEGSKHFDYAWCCGDQYYNISGWYQHLLTNHINKKD